MAYVGKDSKEARAKKDASYETYKSYLENPPAGRLTHIDSEDSLADDVEDTGPQGEPYKLLELVVRFSRVVYRSLLART